MSTPSKISREPFPGVEEVICFFETRSIPPPPIRLDYCGVIIDTKLFIQSHLDVIKAQNGNETFWPDFERLKKLMEILN